VKHLTINLKSKSFKEREAPKRYGGLGGRGLTSTIINREVPAKCDPLGPENKLVLATGFLSGTKLVNISRLSIGAKSPLTGGIKESNAGGSIGLSIGKLGISAIIIEEQVTGEDLFILHIDSEKNVTFHPASEYRGLRTYPLCEKIIDKFGSSVSILCIGPAGERKLKSASIQSSDVDGRPCRSAARGGLGAVMGAMGLKAIVVDQGGNKTRPVADFEGFNEAIKIFAKALKKDPLTEVLEDYGTACTVAPVNTMGAFPSYNAKEGTFKNWDKISGESLADLIKKRKGKIAHQGCSKCIIRCSNECVNEQGKFQTSSLEYETIWAMGGMLGIDDLDIIAKLDFLCDDIGVDTLNTGTAIAIAMDSGFREFGDGQAAIQLVAEIAEGTEIGMLIGHGPTEVGKYFNNKRVPVVKNQSIAGYDPRAMMGTGVTYATSPMGSDHTAGNLIEEYEQGTLDPLDPKGQVEASKLVQIFMTFIDCSGFCLFAGLTLVNPVPEKAFFKLMESLLGKPFNKSSMTKIGIQTLKEELEFNRKAGFTEKDDRLPKFFKEEPLPPHNKVFLISDEELDSIFDF
jgi:aldehyde:ferredoxin oxidoreductase